MNPTPYLTSSAEKHFPRYVLYLVPRGHFHNQLSINQYVDWLHSGWKSNHEYFPHCTLSGFFLQSPVLAQSESGETESNPRQDFETLLRRSLHGAWTDEQAEFPCDHPDTLSPSLDFHHTVRTATNKHSLVFGKSCEKQLIRFANRVSSHISSGAPKTCFRVKNNLHITLSQGDESDLPPSQGQGIISRASTPAQTSPFPQTWGSWSIIMYCQESPIRWRPLSTITLSSGAHKSAQSNPVESLIEWASGSFPTLPRSALDKWISKYMIPSDEQSQKAHDCADPKSEDVGLQHLEIEKNEGNDCGVVLNRNYEWGALC